MSYLDYQNIFWLSKVTNNINMKRYISIKIYENYLEENQKKINFIIQCHNLTNILNTYIIILVIFILIFREEINFF